MKIVTKIEINETYYFQISLSCKPKELTWFDRVDISICDEDTSLCLFNGYALDCIGNTYSFFENVLFGKRELDKRLKSDLGFLWNEYLQNRQHEELIEEQGNDYNFWIGGKYIVWELKKEHLCFCFEKNGIIFLDIASLYPWHFSDPEPDEKYITYEEFIKNYKPLARIEISKETITYLYETFKEFQTILEINDMKYRSKNIQK